MFGFEHLVYKDKVMKRLFKWLFIGVVIMIITYLSLIGWLISHVE